MQLGVGVRTAGYDSVVAAILFGAGAIVLEVLGTTPVGGIAAVVVAAIVNVAIRHVLPSPEARANAETILKLREELGYLGSSAHDIDVARRARQMRRFGPRFPGDRG